jgi:hypothetical protein
MDRVLRYIRSIVSLAERDDTRCGGSHGRAESMEMLDQRESICVDIPTRRPCLKCAVSVSKGPCLIQTLHIRKKNEHQARAPSTVGSIM